MTTEADALKFTAEQAVTAMVNELSKQKIVNF